MRKCVFLALFVFTCVECRKSVPIDKNANAAFINMEGGGYRPPPNNVKPGVAPVNPPPSNNAKPATQPLANPPTSKPLTPEPMKPNAPPTPTKVPSPVPIQGPVPAIQPPKTPSLITPKPVYPTPAVNPITTPGPGSVKQLITFYDSQGKASPIRPYTYSQAVKQG